MAMAAARQAGAGGWLNAAADDYGQTPTFTFPLLQHECELNAKAGLIIDIETTRPRLRKYLDDFEKDSCSQHESKDPTWSTELAGSLAGRKTELPFFRHALETDPWRDYDHEIRDLRETVAAAQAGGAAAAAEAPPAPRRRARRGAQVEEPDGDGDGDAAEVPDEAAGRRAQIEDLEILSARQQSRYAILVKYIRHICSDRVQILLRSRIRRQFPDLFLTGTREHWHFIKDVLEETCAPVDLFAAMAELTSQLKGCRSIIAVVDRVSTFQQVYDDMLPQAHVASTLRYQGFGAEVLRVFATTTDIIWDEDRTLPQWAATLDVLDPRVLAALDTALASRPGSVGGGSQRHLQAYQAPRGPPSTDRAREPCRNFAAGRCKLGNQCPRGHSSAPTRFQGAPPVSTRFTAGPPTSAPTLTQTQRASANGSAPPAHRRAPVTVRSDSNYPPRHCHLCHKTGHHSRDCRSSPCSCGRTGPPTAGCPRYATVSTTLLVGAASGGDSDAVAARYAAANNQHPSAAEVGGNSMHIFPVATPRVGSNALMVDARFHIAGANDLADHTVLLDTGSNCNIIASSVAHNLTTTDPIAVQSLGSRAGGQLTTLRDAGTAYVQYYEGGSVGLKAVHGYVLPDRYMPAAAKLLLGCHSISDLDVDLRRCMLLGPSSGLHRSLSNDDSDANGPDQDVLPDLAFDADSDDGDTAANGPDEEGPPDLIADTDSEDDDDDGGGDQPASPLRAATSSAPPARLASVNTARAPGSGNLFTNRHYHQLRLFDVSTTASLADVRAPRVWVPATGFETWGQSGPTTPTSTDPPSCFWSETAAQAYLDTNPTLSGRWSHLDIVVTTDVPPQLEARVRAWARKNASIFATSEFPPASTQFSRMMGAHDMTAELKVGCKPYHVGARSYKPKEAAVLSLWTRRHLEEGILVPNPTSPWASHIHAVGKQGTTKPRVVVDMRGVNERVLPRPGTMPDGIAELQRASAPARFRISTDALVCYGQFEITPSSYDINTIHTPLGKMAYTRLTMGYQPASRVQQTYYTAAMGSMPPDVQAAFANFADDFNGWADDDDSFMARLDSFADMCCTYGIFLSPTKTIISGPSTDSRFYGFTLRSFDSGGGSSITSDSVSALTNMQMPTSTSEVRQVLGLLNFSRLLVPHYASLVFPCSQLLKKDAFPPGTPFSLPADAEEALRTVVGVLTSNATRYSMDPLVPLQADVDSSTYGWGCHLYQNVLHGTVPVPHTIAWLSKQWPPALRSRPSFVLECHGLFSALKAIRPWAHSNSHPVEVRTDARSILWAHKQSTGPVAGYAAEAAAETPHTISWLPGSTNNVPDALSRPPLVGPRVLATHGLSDLFSMLLDHIAPAVRAARSVWVHARHDTDAMAVIVRRHVSPSCAVTKKASSTDNIASDTVSDLVIVAPEPWRAPSVVRQLLGAGRSFAVLVPHDLIPETARNDDGSYNADTASAMATAVFVGSATSMFTWVVHLRGAASITHLLSLASIAGEGVGVGPAVDTAHQLDVASWVGHQHAVLPPRDGGSIVTRSDGLQLYAGTDGIMRVVVPQHLRQHVAEITHLELQHLGDKFVLQRLRRHFWFPAMHEVVRGVVLGCADCSLSNASRQFRHGDYHAPFAPAPRTRWQLDTKSFGGGRHCLACVDIFSGYLVLIPLRGGRSLQACTQAFIDNIVLVFGVPYSVRVDMSGSFGPGFEHALRRFGIDVSGTGAEHATGNSAVERAWPLLTRHFMIPGNATDGNFESGLRLVAWAHNIAVRPYGISAFETMFASPAISAADRFAYTAADTATGEASATAVAAVVGAHDLTLDNVSAAGRFIRDSTVARMNARTRGAARTFSLGDLVVIYRDPSGNTSDQYGRQRDYIPRWLGPGPITTVRGRGMYDVRVGGTTYLRNVANILPWSGPVPDIAPDSRRCKATAKKSGTRCTGTGRSNGFCGRHQAQAGSSGVAASIGSGDQCTAISSSTGARCTARTKLGTTTCGRHRSSSSADAALPPSGTI